jgi:hypothetical protein
MNIPNPKRMPPNLDVNQWPDPPELTAKDPRPNRTWVNALIYYAVNNADNAEKAGDAIITYSATKLDGRLKWAGQALGYALKYIGKYLDKNFTRVEDLR